MSSRLGSVGLRLCGLLTLVLATASMSAPIATANGAQVSDPGAGSRAPVQIPRATAEGGRDDNAFPAATVDELTSIVQAGMERYNTPGMVVGLWVPGEGTYVRAFGTSDTATAAPLELSDRFRIGSITKTFVATEILMLVDQGRLSLAAPLGRFVDSVPNGDRITIAQLLDMTAGVYDYTSGDDASWKAYTADPLVPFSTGDFLAMLRRHEPLYPPGAKAQYDDSNYFLLGLVVEAVTHRPLAQVIDEDILGPLGLAETSYPTTPAMPSPFTRGYLPQPDGSLRDVTASNPAVAGGAGAMISTLRDQQIWAKALATGTLLEPATQALRLRTRLLASGPVTVKYGMGIGDINGFLGHDGAIFGYSSITLYLPDRDATLVVLGNTYDPSAPSTPTDEVVFRLAFALFPEQFPDGL